jgi:hypothetical protein
MELQEIIEKLIAGVARRGVDHLIARSGVARVCAHCRTDHLEAFSLTLPCCGRVLCGPCASRSCLQRWERRCVIRCDDCEMAHMFNIE